MKHWCALLLFNFANNLLAQTDSVKVYEGFYSHGWELTYFIPLQKDSTLKTGWWLRFKPNYPTTDSLQGVLLAKTPNEYHYLKVEAELHTGANGYGHMGAAKGEIIVHKILAVDTTLTMNLFLSRRK